MQLRKVTQFSKISHGTFQIYAVAQDPLKLS
jgi:hypothetical protein